MGEKAKEFFKSIKINIPSDEELQAMHRKRFEENKENPNAISYWYPKTKVFFRTPYTEIIQMPWEIWDELSRIEECKLSDEDLTKWVKDALYRKYGGTISDNDRFMKLGSFSGKFNFENCFVRRGEFDQIGKKLKNIVYDCLLVGYEFIPEVAIRYFIETSYDRPSIYNGMKLNTEFRVFVNFDMKEVMGVVNYWDYDTMMKGIYDETDRKTFQSVGRDIEKDFNFRKGDLEQLVDCKLHLKNSPKLTGIWSMDFLWDGKNFILIDMALAQQSYYYEKIYPEWESRLKEFYKVKESEE